MFKTPILFLIFNRLDTAQKVFEKIKEQKPKYLYIAADGPRKNRKGEDEACKRTREEILKQIDRDCELKTLFRDENLGCKKAVSGAITRFFENVEQGIILEDDCLPDSSFFGFCETLLEKYKDDERVMMISGDCFLPEKWQKDDEYTFTKYPHIRGWSTRKRAWNCYDIEMKELQSFIQNKMINYISSDYFTKKVFIKHFKEVKSGKIDTWDYQRIYSMWMNSGLSVYPLTNLINNIGFSSDALHTKNDFGLGGLKTNEIRFSKLKEPSSLIINNKYERYDEINVLLSFKQWFANIFREIGIYKIVAKMLFYKA